MLAVLAAFLASVVPKAAAREQRPVRAVAINRAQLQLVLGRILEHRDETWRWQRLMHERRTPYAGSARWSFSLGYRRWVLDVWQRRALRARARAQNPPRKRDWLCIHGYEAAWDDPDPPYFGVLQMDLEFQRTYGPELLRAKGTADKWTPLEQIWVAVRAYRRGRGFYPWPNTARYCGLI